MSLGILCKHKEEVIHHLGFHLLVFISSVVEIIQINSKGVGTNLDWMIRNPLKNSRKREVLWCFNRSKINSISRVDGNGRDACLNNRKKQCSERSVWRSRRRLWRCNRNRYNCGRNQLRRKFLAGMILWRRVYQGRLPFLALRVGIPHK